MIYVLDETVLEKGDIILIREDTNESREIMKRSNSDFHHAMLYRAISSYLESDGTLVRAMNTQRKPIKQEQDVAVLRLKQMPEWYTVEKALNAAGAMVGMDYSTREAFRALTHQGKAPVSPNLQFCTRFVAQAYAAAGVQLVDDPNYCTPQQILDSPLLMRVDGPLRLAHPEEIVMGEEKNPIAERDENRLGSFLENARGITGGDEQTLKQLSAYMILHPELDTSISAAMVQSGFLETWKEEEAANPEHYDTKVFHALIIDPIAKIMEAVRLVETAEEQLEGYEPEYEHLIKQYKSYPLRYFELQVELYKNLIDQKRRILAMCDKIMDD
ncbi:YiiX/YebB-like N1pC/P60 family cysteine hydrolase [Mucilaginibacter flavidus]|uniref:YiiX/YebB-like N1pC/P60 family cysteine hydrolase n=1 Tax=Mucilaginibacter flavidus TaxID=2949309 RepID=UPI0020928345|nr:YiiX/YebB-like N1pC/P60 family cysteine hydrolase [Mucilaginibacter flavidus]MCO5950907.1 hypothetical protein [Mucilaginibacter flavidus]